MQLAAVESVRCVEGCGGGTETLGIIGLVVALLSLAVAIKAWMVSDASLRIARAEHREFEKKLNARADFALDLALDNPEPRDGVVDLTTQKAFLRWKIDINNIGEIAADGVTVEFLFPSDIAVRKADIGWTMLDGSWMGTGNADDHVPLPTSEEVTTDDGESVPAEYLVKDMGRISVTRRPVLFAGIKVERPKRGEEIRVPVSVRIRSDDLPDDVDDRRAFCETILRHAG
ncbi:MAG: hypothetical protein R2725_13300 [Solirubrobacterales bacterium]